MAKSLEEQLTEGYADFLPDAMRRAIGGELKNLHCEYRKKATIFGPVFGIDYECRYYTDKNGQLRFQVRVFPYHKGTTLFLIEEPSKIGTGIGKSRYIAGRSITQNGKGFKAECRVKRVPKKLGRNNPLYEDTFKHILLKKLFKLIRVKDNF